MNLRKDHLHHGQSFTSVVHYNGACPHEWHAFACAGGCAISKTCTSCALLAFNTRPSVNNVSARLAMKNVANSDMHRDLQRVEN